MNDTYLNVPKVFNQLDLGLFQVLGVIKVLHVRRRKVEPEVRPVVLQIIVEREFWSQVQAVLRVQAERSIREKRVPSLISFLSKSAVS